MSIKITCLSENTVPFSTPYWAEHGLSFYIESESIRLLYDTGQSGDVLLHNARAMGIDLKGLDAIVLSHGHYDHTGGLAKVLDMNEGVPLIAHPFALYEKRTMKDGRLKSIGIPLTMEELKRRCCLILETTPVDITDSIWTSGEIPRVTAYEEPDQSLLMEWKGCVFTDPLKDDMSLVIKGEGDMVLLCGCCHSGIVNTIEYIRQQFGEYPHTIAGGLHMHAANGERLAKTAEALKAAGVKKVIAGHCSGEKVLQCLPDMGIGCERLHAGKRIV